MNIRTATGAALAALVLATCTIDEASPPRADPTDPATPAARPTTRPKRGPVVKLEAVGYARPLLRQGIGDLKRIGFWDDLTAHLYLINLDSRLGRLNVPKDGHLADAYFTGTIDAGGAGALCDVMFFPTAIRDDLRRWRLYYSQGRIAEAPPSLEDFYASLIAHELAHCSLGARGEPAAQAWERRTRAALLRS